MDGGEPGKEMIVEKEGSKNIKEKKYTKKQRKRDMR